MAFTDEALKDGRGKVIRIDVSVDKFSSVSYRWGGAAGLLDGTNQYSSRVMSVTPIRRGLGESRVAGGGTCQVTLANADGSLDALVGSSAIGTQAKLRLRVYVCLYTLGVDPPVFTSKLLGEFSLTDWIRQDNETLTLSLGDDVMGAVSQQAALPTLTDWQAVGTTANNPLKNGMGLPDVISEYSPIQLAFGEDWVLAFPHIISWEASDAAYVGTVTIPVCVTTDTGAGSSYELDQLRVHYLDRAEVPRLRDVPRTVNASALGGSSSDVIWRTERSPTITKDGKSFKVIYIVVDCELFTWWIDTEVDAYQVPPGTTYASDIEAEVMQHMHDGGYPTQAVDWAGRGYWRYVSRVFGWYVKGFPLSARTQTTSPVQHPVDVLSDLVGEYSNNAEITVDTAMAARVKAATRNAACAGVVQPWVSGPKGGDPIYQPAPSLRGVLSALCQSSDIDSFIDWSGQFSFAADLWDFTIATSGTASWTPDAAYQTSGNGTSTSYIPTVIPETWLADGAERWIPGNGDRWAPYNRLWFNGGKASPADGVTSPPYQGPFDFDAGQPSAVLLSDRVIEATFEQGWRPYRQQARTPWFWRTLNIVARDAVRFRTHLGGLQLELGQFFALSWTRGTTLGGPYSGTIFQCESITYSPEDDTVEVTAIWRHDVMTERQYLLDDETLLVRSKGALTGSASTVGGSDLVFFGGTINLTTMGVAAGDILVLRHSTEAADSFEFNAAYRVTAVGGAGFLGVPSAFANAASIINADWAIYRGATTYHTAVSDPTNYPLGGDRYGKVTATSGLYSNAGDGNRLISG